MADIAHSHLDQKLTQAPAQYLRLRCRSERDGPSRSHPGGAQLITTLKSEYDLNAHRLFGPDETCDTTLARFGSNSCVILKQTKEIDMANRQQRGNREAKKPKKEKIKTIAAAPSQKGAAAGWQPNLASGKKK